MRKSIFTFGLGLSMVALTSWGQIAEAFPLRQISIEKLRFVGLDDKLGNQEVDSSKKSFIAGELILAVLMQNPVKHYQAGMNLNVRLC